MGRTSLVLLFLLTSCLCYPNHSIRITNSMAQPYPLAVQTYLDKAEVLFQKGHYYSAMEAYGAALGTTDSDSAYIYRKLALCAAALGKSSEAASHLEASLQRDFDISFLLNEGLDVIRNSKEFQKVVDTYTPKHKYWSFGYLYVSLIGFYIAFIINFNRKIDRIARLLISSFVFMHSFFILHIWLTLTNYQFEFPHSYLMSTCFSFLYGPLLYFYFKRITQQYQFKWQDLAHLIPSLVFLIYIIPIYALPASEKLELMFNRLSSGLNPSDSAFISLIVSLKLASLIVYAIFIYKLYQHSRVKDELSHQNRVWQKYIIGIHLCYIGCYSIYGFLISNDINFGVLYHLQVICMALMVLYIGYSANVQPHLFSGIFSDDNQNFFKYKNSGLTDSLSEELKESLIRLFDQEKIYKESDISLDMLALKMNTTRHNASQVINEHFNLGFHELINQYRIREARYILDTDSQKNLNIIDIAYEVGYNNKVTFNKAFKKNTRLTPSEYQKAYVHTDA